MIEGSSSLLDCYCMYCCIAEERDGKRSRQQEPTASS